MMDTRLCERSVGGVRCTKGPGGGPAEAVEQVDRRWYCRHHVGAAKAVSAKRRDRGFGLCSVVDCVRPATEAGGKCVEHLAGERAAAGTVVIVGDSGRGGHPYARKQAEVYLALFREVGLLKIGKATPWTVHQRVKDAADKLWIRQAQGRDEQLLVGDVDAWSIAPFGEETVLWAEIERVEHATAGRLARNLRAKSVDHTEGKEWLHCDRPDVIDWPDAFRKALRDTLEFLYRDPPSSGPTRRLE